VTKNLFNKFIASSATAVLVTTVAAPVAGAVDLSDYKDNASFSAWAKEGIAYVSEKEIMVGYNGEFSPQRTITRGEIAKVMAVSLGLVKPGETLDKNVETGFSDVGSHWSAPYIKLLTDYNENIINGYVDGTFKPDQEIRRDELAKIIVKAFNLTENDKVKVHFNDSNNWAKSYIDILAGQGIIMGSAPNVFSPEAPVTRETAAVIAYRTLEGKARIPADQNPSVEVVIPETTATYRVDENVTVGLEDIMKDMINGSTTDTIQIYVPESSTVTWTTGAAHGSTPLVPEGSKIKEVIFNGGGTFKALGDGVGPIRAANGGKIVFNDMTIVDESESYAENSWEFGYLEFAGNLEFVNTTFKNSIMFEGDTVSFTNSSFNSNKENEYAVWISDGIASFDHSTFEGHRGIKIHEAYGSDVDSVTVDNTTFELGLKPGVAIGDVDATTTVTIKNSVFNTQPGDQGEYIYESDTLVNTFNLVLENNTINK